MAKRKRSAHRQDSKRPHDDVDSKASKLVVNSYEDVGDSADEFHANREEILLDESPRAKRLKQHEQDELMLSDEEILGYSESEASAEVSNDNDGELNLTDADDDDEASRGRWEDSENDGIGGWGPNKSDYYNADEVETEQDMFDEEAEARRIQQKQRKALNEADFGFDEHGWFSRDGPEVSDADGERGGILTETLPPLQIDKDMSSEDRSSLLESRYPEFTPLAQEMLRLHPIYETISKQVLDMDNNVPHDANERMPLLMLKFRALSGYMGAISMYFALLTSTAQEHREKSLPMPAAELREHDVIASIEQFHRLWNIAEELGSYDDSASDTKDAAAGSADVAAAQASLQDAKVRSTLPEYSLGEMPVRQARTAKTVSEIRRDARLRKTEEALNELSSTISTQQQRSTFPAATTAIADEFSDAGDEQPLLSHELAEKARKRKSLRFYTSQIAQKASRRANAGRSTGGDDDIPYRERLRDRQERLNREAEKRGKTDDVDAMVHEDVGDGQIQGLTNREQEELDEDGQALQRHVLTKKDAKRQKDEAYKIAKQEGGKVVVRQASTIGPDGRRDIGYVIEKNKGLTPKRKKIVKNPRVKKRMRFEDKSKKLRSMKPTYKGGEAKGGYGGEMTGIKQNLIRSTKL